MVTGPMGSRASESALLARLRRATLQEHAAQETLERGSALIVRSGIRLECDEPRYRLVLSDQPNWLRRGTRARLRTSEGVCFQVEVRMAGARTEVTSDEPIPHDLTGARLTLTGSELTAALARRLASLGSGSRRNALAAKALGIGSPRKRCADPRLADDVAFRLNEQQLASVTNALMYDVSWVWGPPGTGKTAMLAELIVERRRQGLSTLVIAPTNQAVDILASRTLALLPDVLPGDVVRAGSRPTHEFIADPAFLLSSQKTSRGAPAADVLAEASIVFCTADYVYMSNNCECGFDGVIVDEAALLPAPKLYVAAALARASVTLAGDFMQGRPISLARAADYALDTFRAVGLPESVAREDRPGYMTQLEEQHRMPPDVRAWVSELWYAGRLQDSPARRTCIPPRSPLGRSSLLLVDTSDIGGAAIRDRNGSVANESHARVVRALLGYLMDGPTGAVEPFAGGVMVITPFCAQRRTLLRAIPEAYIAAGVDVCSAYEAQGTEVGTVILDLTVSSSTPRSGILGSSSLDDIGSAAIVVGATRCSERLIMVADIGSMLRGGRAVADQVCTLLREHAEEISLESINPALVGL